MVDSVDLKMLVHPTLGESLPCDDSDGLAVKDICRLSSL